MQAPFRQNSLQRVRRLLLGLFIGVAALTVLIAHVQRAVLVEETVRELESLSARRGRVPTFALAPKHRDGFACVASAWRRAPLTGTASNSLAHDAAMLLPSLPTSLRAELGESKPRLDALRDCANSEFVEPFTSAEPFNWRDDDYRTAMRALSRATEEELRVLAEKSEWGEIATLCAPTIELVLQQTHINLGAIPSVLHQLKRLVPVCVRALHLLDAESRGALGSRFVRLIARMPDRASLLEVGRIREAASALSPYMDESQRARVPWLPVSQGYDPPIPFEGFRMARLVRARAPIIRSIVSHVMARGPALEADLAALARVEASWWAPWGVHSEPYVRFTLGSLDDLDDMLQLLATSAIGENDYPPRVWRSWNGLCLNLWGGKTLEIPLSSP